MKSKYLICVIAALWFWAPALQLRGIPLWVNLGGGGSSASADPGYEPFTAVFDGTTDFIRRTVTLTGLDSGKLFTFACWVKPSGDSGTRVLMNIGTGSTKRFQIHISGTTQKVAVTGWNASAAQILQITSTGTVTAAAGWTHILVVIDMDSEALCKIYLDGVEGADAAAIFTTGGTLDLDPTTSPRTTIGGDASTSPADFFSGELADLMFDDVYLDDPTKFIIVSGGYPVSPGSNGSTAFGSSPSIYFSGAGNGDTWATNSGGGGVFTLTGTLGTGTSP